MTRRAGEGGLDALVEGVDLDPRVLDLIRDLPREWAVSADLASLLARLVAARRARSVLEFGAGRSSVVLATALSLAGGGRLTTVEHEPAYSAEAWTVARSTPGVDALLVTAPLRREWSREGCLYSYAGVHDRLGPRGPFDLVFVDAPPGRFGRDTALHAAFPHLEPRALIVLDDAGRVRESSTRHRWLQRYRGIRLAALEPEFGTAGVAVFEFTGDRARRVALKAFVGSLHDRWLEWRYGLS
jgi:predicted O-methyltransferase YrrM